MKFWSYTLLIAVALLVAACASVDTPAPTLLKPTRFAAPEPIQPVTATPIPLGSHAIYVVDPRNGYLVSQVLVVDPDARREVRRLQTRDTPEIGFAPDGKRLYVADSYSTRVTRGERRDVVSVYNAAMSQLLHDDVDIPKRLLYKGFPNAHSYTFLSRDGTRLFVGKYGDPDIHALRLAVLDANTFQQLTEFPRPDCDLLPLRDGRLLCVVGQAQPRLLDPLTGAITDIPASLPAISKSAILSPSGERLYLLTSGLHVPAQVTVIDFVPSPPRVLADEIALDAPPNCEIGFQVALSPDESRLYIGFLLTTTGSGLASEIWAFDTKTWTRTGTFKLSDPAWHIAVSNDGKQLYSVSPFKKSLTIFDAHTFQEIGTIRDLGDTPALIVVPPR